MKPIVSGVGAATACFACIPSGIKPTKLAATARAAIREPNQTPTRFATVRALTMAQV